MKKDYTRDYATEAFRLFAKQGKPTYEQAAERIRADARRRCEFKEPQIICDREEIAVAKKTPELLDILAVNETIALLERSGREYIAEAVREVYFVAPDIPLRRGEINARVRRLSIMMPASERSIYGWLKKARLLFAATRGLRIECDEKTLQ